MSSFFYSKVSFFIQKSPIFIQMSPFFIQMSPFFIQDRKNWKCHRWYVPVGDKTKAVTKILLTIFAGSLSGSRLVSLKSFSKCPWSLSLYVTNFFKMIGCSSATKLEKRTTLSNNSGSFSEYGSGLFSVLWSHSLVWALFGDGLKISDGCIS